MAALLNKQLTSFRIFMTTVMLGGEINGIFCIFVHSSCGDRCINHEMGLVFQSPVSISCFDFPVVAISIFSAAIL